MPPLVKIGGGVEGGLSMMRFQGRLLMKTLAFPRASLAGQMALMAAGLVMCLILLAAARGDDDKERIADVDVAAWVSLRVAQWQPTDEERRFDEIAWVKDIREALRLAKEYDRPVFLFTHDGHMAVGRC
jgi:hypothetical protein